MRILMRDMTDNTLIAIHCAEIFYEPNEKILYLYSINDTEFNVFNVSYEDSEFIIKVAIKEQFFDLTKYPAIVRNDDIN